MVNFSQSNLEPVVKISQRFQVKLDNFNHLNPELLVNYSSFVVFILNNLNSSTITSGAKISPASSNMF